MATKNQLKQYFETGKIPTQAQFSELIDFVQPLISDDSIDRPNQTLRFGSDGSQPIINGLRIIHYYANSDTIFNFWLFTNEATGNNLSGISVPVFVILRITDENLGIPSGNDKLRYFIPEAKDIQSWVSLGVDCDTASDDDICNALQNWPFKIWPEGGGSEFPRVAYIDGQSAWDTWYNNFKTAHPESGNSGGNGSPILNQRLIDGYTFIIETSDEINFYSNETLEFVNCTIINNDTTEESISMNFTNCTFKNCHIDSGYRVSGGNFENCTLNIDANINNANIKRSTLHGGGSTYECDLTDCNVSVNTFEAGSLTNCITLATVINSGVAINGGILHGCSIYSAKLTALSLQMVLCTAADKNAFNGSSNVITGFIWGCDFSKIEDLPGVMRGVQCCKFKSTLLSSGVIFADIFGNKNAASNGMNTGV